MVSLSMPLSGPWHEFQASRGIVSDSWAFLFYVDDQYVENKYTDGNFYSRLQTSILFFSQKLVFNIF